MNPAKNLLNTSALVLAMSASVYASEKVPSATTPAYSTPPPAAAPATPPADPVTAAFKKGTDWMPQAIKDGKFILDVRPRYELADQAGLDVSHAYTIRTRFGYETAKFYGFSGLLEFEDVTVIGDEDNFNAAGTTGAGKTVIADPDVTEVNQAWIAYENFKTVVKGGRQRIILDNHRFIGNVGWRQNEQTFDAASVRSTILPDTTLFYGYLWHVNRVFGDVPGLPAANKDFDSDSHLLNASYNGFKAGAVTAYAYLLDFDNSPMNSSHTYGASFAGGYPICHDIKLNYRAEFAYQFDYANNPVNYEAEYYNVEMGAAWKWINGGAGYEVLGSDNGFGFRTPLATLHAFNGWADTFLVTPGAGLEDIYAWIGVTLPYNVPLKVIYHDYSANAGSMGFGCEWNAVISRQFGKHFNALAKYAYYDGDGGFASRQKFWFQVEFKY